MQKTWSYHASSFLGLSAQLTSNAFLNEQMNGRAAAGLFANHVLAPVKRHTHYDR